MIWTTKDGIGIIPPVQAAFLQTNGNNKSAQKLYCQPSISLATASSATLSAIKDIKPTRDWSSYLRDHTWERRESCRRHRRNIALMRLFVWYWQARVCVYWSGWIRQVQNEQLAVTCFPMNSIQLSGFKMSMQSSWRMRLSLVVLLASIKLPDLYLTVSALTCGSMLIIPPKCMHQWQSNDRRVVHCFRSIMIALLSKYWKGSYLCRD